MSSSGKLNVLYMPTFGFISDYVQLVVLQETTLSVEILTEEETCSFLLCILLVQTRHLFSLSMLFFCAINSRNCKNKQVLGMKNEKNSSITQRKYFVHFFCAF